MNEYSINWGWFQLESWNGGWWFRIFGKGLIFNKDRLNFSERNGYVKYLKLPFNWRVKKIKDFKKMLGER